MTFPRTPVGRVAQQCALVDHGLTLLRFSGFDVALLDDVAVLTELLGPAPRDFADTAWADAADEHQRPDEQILWCSRLLCRTATTIGATVTTVARLVAAFGLPGSRDLRLLPMLLCGPSAADADTWIARPPRPADLSTRLATKGWLPLGRLAADARLTGWPWTLPGPHPPPLPRPRSARRLTLVPCPGPAGS